MCWEGEKFQDQGRHNAYVYSSMFSHLTETQTLKENISLLLSLGSATLKQAGLDREG